MTLLKRNTSRWLQRLFCQLACDANMPVLETACQALPPLFSTAAPANQTSHGGMDAGRGGLRDFVRFLIEWVRDPISTAAVAPSGKALASLITSRIGPQSGAVLELGPGTGVFTRGLILRGVDERDLTLIEYNANFSRLLEDRYPGAQVFCMDAAALPGFEHGHARAFGAAVCGLGLRNMDPPLVEAIMRAAFNRMKPDAALYLFTYGRRCSVPVEVLARLGLSAERIGTAYRNLPPAAVYRVARSSIAPVT